MSISRDNQDRWNDNTTLTDQVYRKILGQIESGLLLPGQKIPSRRGLAESLGVSTTTIESAYGRLIEEGICESRPKSGIYVIGLPEHHEMNTVRDVPVQWDFGTGAMDAEQFPYSTWAKLMREVLTEQSDDLLRAGDPQGSKALRHEIAQMVRKNRGIEVKPEQIVLGAGTDMLESVLISLIGRERLFAVEDPGYSRARRILVAGGARIVPIALSDGAVNVQMLYQTGAGAVYVTPGCQFPTGSEMPEDCRRRLLTWARETGGYILEDDYECEFSFGETRQPPLISEDVHARVIYMNTFARTLAPGLRISYMILPEMLVERYREMYSACSVPGFEQAALAKFISGGYFERHINRMRTVYRQRLSILEKEIERLHLGTLMKNQTGLFELLRVPEEMNNVQTACEKARRVGILITPVEAFSVMSGITQYSDCVVIGLAGMDEEKMKAGLEALASAWNL